jgi:hypothetical protein
MDLPPPSLPLNGQIMIKRESPQAKFCGKWAMDEAMGKLLDIKFQDCPKFPKLLSEMYAHAVNNESKELFSFLETRFNKNIIQDKEVHLHFEVVNSIEEARQ